MASRRPSGHSTPKARRRHGGDDDLWGGFGCDYLDGSYASDDLYGGEDDIVRDSNSDDYTTTTDNDDGGGDTGDICHFIDDSHVGCAVIGSVNFGNLCDY